MSRGNRREINVRGILLVAGSEFVRWLVNPKMFVFAIIFLPLRDLIVLPMMQASEKMGSPLGILESSIATMNSLLGVILLTLTYLLLISSFPTVDGNVLFYIARMGRRNWILGEMLFHVISAVAYSLLITVVSAAQIAAQSFWANGWSLVVTDYDRMFGQEGGGETMRGLIPPNLYFQMAPVKAYLLSFGLLTLFFILLGLIFLAGVLCGKRVLCFLLQVVHLIPGCGMIMLNSSGMWGFPLAHAMLLFHYQEYMREYECSPWLSIVLFSSVLAVVVFGLYRTVKGVSLDLIGEGVAS